MRRRARIKRKIAHSEVARNVALIGMMAATLEIAKIALFYLPNIEIVSLLIMIYAGVFRKKTFYAIYIFVALEICFWGFGTWTFCYLYVWSILAAIALLFREEQSPLLIAAISGIFGLMFGALCMLPDLLIGGLSLAFSRFVSGVPFDLLHCGGNFIAALLLYRPLYRLMKKCNIRYFTHASSQ